MHESFDFSDYARQFRALAGSLICSGRKATEISGQMHLLNFAAERDLLRFGAAEERMRVVCGPGCGACCVLNVDVFLPEAIAITRYLQQLLTDEEIGELRDRLHELWVRTRWLDNEERLFVHEPCAFLDQEGSCMIHKVRPLLCRAISSTDSKACRSAIAMAPLDGEPHVEMNLFQKQLFETAFCELGRALEVAGLDHRPRRLSMATLQLLAEPEIVDAYVSGMPIPLH